MNQTTRKLLRTDGSERSLQEPCTASVVRELIHADSVEFVPLRNMGEPLHVMAADRLGYHKHLPVNVAATKFYLSHSARTGKHKIRGDVVIAPASELRELGQQP
jgi:hypothetical protein